MDSGRDSRRADSLLILTRSRRIRNALLAVRARIPSKDWQAISAFLSRIYVDTEWRTLGISEEIDPVSAELRPLLDSEDLSVCGAQILFRLPLCRLYSNKAMIGLVAHELAHALRAAQIGKGWREKMGDVWDAPGADRKYRSGERWADGVASAWGFRPQIRAMREERRAVLIPYIRSQEKRILRQIQRRYREHEKSRPSWART